MSGILHEKIIEAMKKYEERKYDVIYAHMFDKSVWSTLSKKNNNITNEMIIGEAIHRGASVVLDDTKEVCKSLTISIGNIIPPALERFVKFNSEGEPYVDICGEADGFYNGYPIELKTTRSSKRVFEPEKEWVRRGRIYGWLYDVDKAYLIVFNVINGKEVDHILQSYSNAEMRDITEKWLKGVFPALSLPISINIKENVKKQKRKL